MDLDKTLDELVKAQRVTRPRRAKATKTAPGVTARRGIARRAAIGRGARQAARGRVAVRGGRAPAVAPRNPQIIRVPEEAKGKRLFVANVAQTVNADDLRELFQNFNCIKADVHYSPQGKHLGTAIVECRSAADAEAGRKEFSGRALDGKSLQISVIAEEGNKSLAARLGTNAPVSLLASLTQRPTNAASTTSRARGGRGRARGRGRGRGRA